MKSSIAAAAVFGLLVLCLIAARFFSEFGSFGSSWKWDEQAAKEAIRRADDIWDSGKTAEAIAAYKQFLRDHDDTLSYPLWDDTLTARPFRRVIEYELQYGDTGEARDYMVEALRKYRLHHELSMDTVEGKQLMQDVSGR